MDGLDISGWVVRYRVPSVPPLDQGVHLLQDWKIECMKPTSNFLRIYAIDTKPIGTDT